MVFVCSEGQAISLIRSVCAGLRCHVSMCNYSYRKKKCLRKHIALSWIEYYKGYGSTRIRKGKNKWHCWVAARFLLKRLLRCCCTTAHYPPLSVEVTVEPSVSLMITLSCMATQHFLIVYLQLREKGTVPPWSFYQNTCESLILMQETKCQLRKNQMKQRLPVFFCLPQRHCLSKK